MRNEIPRYGLCRRVLGELASGVALGSTAIIILLWAQSRASLLATVLEFAVQAPAVVVAIPLVAVMGLWLNPAIMLWLSAAVWAGIGVLLGRRHLAGSPSATNWTVVAICTVAAPVAVAAIWGLCCLLSALGAFMGRPNIASLTYPRLCEVSYITSVALPSGTRLKCSSYDRFDGSRLQAVLVVSGSDVKRLLGSVPQPHIVSSEDRMGISDGESQLPGWRPESAGAFKACQLRLSEGSELRMLVDQDDRDSAVVYLDWTDHYVSEAVRTLPRSSNPR